MFKVKSFKGLHHKKIWIDSMIGMTWGFIASLVVGTIIGLFGINQNNEWSHFTSSIKGIMTMITPFAIGVGVGYKAKLKPLQIMAIMVATGLVGHSTLIPHMSNNQIAWDGRIGFLMFKTINNQIVWIPGDVFGAWLMSVVVLYFFSIFEWDFMLDILLVPLVGAILGGIGSLWIAYLTSTVTVGLEWTIEHTVMKDHWAGILLAPVIGIIMGLALSLPTSSAAMALALNLKGDAATAAMAGTAAQMISFGVMTYLSTKSIGKAVAVGFGTSMLQMPNFAKKPMLLVIPALMSGLFALLATATAPLHFASYSSPTSGMGSCALYGQIFTLQENGWGSIDAWMNVLFLQLLGPAITTLVLGNIIFKKTLWIKKESLLI